MSLRSGCFPSVVLGGLLFLTAFAPLHAQSPPLWRSLPTGPHAVGFSTSWQFDQGRRYNMVFADKTSFAPDKSPRPILINTWYPAKAAADAKKMVHGDYLKIQSADPRLTKFANLLADYERSVMIKELTGKEPGKLSARETALFEELLNTPTACVRGAAQAPGLFPCVIYHAGAGSSYEDNSVLCEFLASHGFIVLGSAFQDQTGKVFNTDNREGSLGDLAFLIALTRQIPGADWNHVGIVGHSAGAQAALRYGVQADCAADAIVSLDTTQDYYSIANPLWETFLGPVVKNGKQFTRPLLMAAGARAPFELGDSLKNCRRHYLTFKDLDHNDYIAQGNFAREMQVRLQEEDTTKKAAAKAEEKQSKERVAQEYRALCSYILRFFEAELKKEPEAIAYLAKEYRNTSLGGAVPHAEFVPEKATGPDPYREGSETPPTPRQLRVILREQGAAKTIALLKRFRTATPSPLHNEQSALALVTDCLDRGNTAEAIAFRDYFRETGKDYGKTILQIAEEFHKMGFLRWAAINYKRIAVLDPANREVAQKLKEVQDAMAKQEGP